MALENAEFISELVPANPLSGDPPTQGDDHIRVTKKAVQQSFPNINEAVTVTPTELNQLGGLVVRELAPTGMIGMFISNSPPNGWLFCDGSAIPAQHADLIALVGANTPDLRDKFIRGSGAARNPLTAQVEQIGSHVHSGVIKAVSDTAFAVTQTIGSHPRGGGGDTTGGIGTTTDANTGTENRPANTALAYMIKT